ncbi:MAG: thiamine pyrophosphate-dependent enzyme [Melioribacteraceae bacterium]|nr:thiamine pyrophosphate-dependent enzyme [Melioribacteraceae bacterium]
MKATVSDTIAIALKDLGVDIITHVPGFGGSEAFESYKKINFKTPPISFHEEVAYTICHGASIVGKRSACFIKAQGIAKAANSVVDSLYTSVTAGFVTFIFDDNVGNHSDNIMETEALLKGLSLPYIIADTITIYDDVITAFHKSEKVNLPVAIIINAAEIFNETEFEQQSFRKNFIYERDILQHVVHPLFAQYQYDVFKSKKNGNLNSEIKKPKLIQVPDEIPERSKDAVKRYQQFFNIFQNFKGDIVTGDTSSSSSYALPPYDAIDIVTYIGGSIPLAIGAYLAGNRYTWAMTGDFGFIAAGHLGLLEASLRQIPLKVVIFNNKQAAATGGQPIHRTTLYKILAGYENYIRNISNPEDPFEVTEILDEATQADELRIIIVNY